MKPLFSILILTTLLFSCNNDDDDPTLLGCGSNTSFLDLDWLTQEIERREQSDSPDIQYCYISQALLNNTSVFIYNDCNPVIYKVIPVLNCAGESIGFIGSDINQGELLNQQIIWKPEDFACTVD